MSPNIDRQTCHRLTHMWQNDIHVCRHTFMSCTSTHKLQWQIWHICHICTVHCKCCSVLQCVAVCCSVLQWQIWHICHILYADRHTCHREIDWHTCHRLTHMWRCRRTRVSSCRLMHKLQINTHVTDWHTSPRLHTCHRQIDTHVCLYICRSVKI